MSKDLAWARKMHNTFPPTGYNLTGEDIEVFMQVAGEKYADKMSFCFDAIITAYNYGFQRGQNAAHNQQKRARSRGNGQCVHLP